MVRLSKKKEKEKSVFKRPFRNSTLTRHNLQDRFWLSARTQKEFGRTLERFAQLLTSVGPSELMPSRSRCLLHYLIADTEGIIEFELICGAQDCRRIGMSWVERVIGDFSTADFLSDSKTHVDIGENEGSSGLTRQLV